MSDEEDNRSRLPLSSMLFSKQTRRNRRLFPVRISYYDGSKGMKTICLF